MRDGDSRCCPGAPMYDTSAHVGTSATVGHKHKFETRNKCSDFGAQERPAGEALPPDTAVARAHSGTTCNDEERVLTATQQSLAGLPIMPSPRLPVRRR